MTFVPLKQGQYLVCDATCVDTFCQSHCPRVVTEPGGAAAHAEEEKIKKYAHLDTIFIFQPVDIETCGSIGPVSKPFLRDLGRQLGMVSWEPRSYEFPMQRISAAINSDNIIICFVVSCFNWWMSGATVIVSTSPWVVPSCESL